MLQPKRDIEVFTLEIKKLRGLLFVGAAIYPLWGLLFTWIDTRFHDPLWIRLLISSAFAGVAWISSKRGISQTAFSWLFQLAITSMTLHYMWLIWANKAAAIYSSGSFLILMICLVASPSTWGAILYSVIGSLAAFGVYAFTVDPVENPAFFLAGVVTANILGLIVHQNRMSMLSQVIETESRYWTMVENLSEGVILQDKSGTIRSTNTSAQALLGLTRDQMEGRSSVDPTWSCIRENGEPWPGDTHPAMMAIKTGESQIGKIMGVRKPDSSLCWITINALPLFENESKEPTAVLVSFHDITERKLAQDLLTEQQARLTSAAKMSALGEMASGIAHEINNPMAIISGRATQIARIIEKDPLDKKKIHELIKNIETMVERVTKIIQGLRSFAREGANDPFVPTPLKSLIDDVLVLCKERFTKSGVDVQVSSFPENLTFDCRPSQISQILLNLLQNAYDAIGESKEKWIRLDVKEDVDTICLSVEDSGPGIPKDIRDKIMQPFYTTKPIGKGTGLGLSISMGIIKAHSGSLFLDENCRNTKFVFILPKTQSLSKAA